MLQLLIVVIGLGAVLADSATVFLVMKLLGGAYLIFLGLRTIRSRRELAELLAHATVRPRPLRATIREGFLVGATNPKGLVIFTAVLPTFVDRAQGHATLQLATLGVICGLIAAFSDGTWAIASGTVRAWLGRSPRRLEWMSAGGGVTMIALGAGLAISGRR
jgi:threonine/homoserine/homoserine lactone efflux protein